MTTDEVVRDALATLLDALTTAAVALEDEGGAATLASVQAAIRAFVDATVGGGSAVQARKGLPSDAYSARRQQNVFAIGAVDAFAARGGREERIPLSSFSAAPDMSAAVAAKKAASKPVAKRRRAQMGLWPGDMSKALADRKLGR